MIPDEGLALTVRAGAHLVYHGGAGHVEQRPPGPRQAQAWRLRQAVINGQPWQRAAAEARGLVDLLVADQPSHRALADDLFTVLDGTAHASSLIETINGLLKAFLQTRQAFQSLATAQAYLNLLVLWHIICGSSSAANGRARVPSNGPASPPAATTGWPCSVIRLIDVAP